MILRSCYILLAFCFCLTQACSPVFVSKAAYHQTKLLANRIDTDKLIESKDTEQKIRDKIILTRDILSFAKDINLNSGANYTTFSNYKFPQQWVVTASEEFSLIPYTWWFPIVGSVPYKGFFEKEDALEEAALLKNKGYDVSIRTASAFSTLGWFNDPLTDSLISLSEIDFIATLFHELFHATIWIPNQVAFNETMANAFGYYTALEFIKIHRTDLTTNSKQALSYQCKAWKKISELGENLKLLYVKDIPVEEKRSEKAKIFEAFKKDINFKNKATEADEIYSYTMPNNAFYIGLATYYENFNAAIKFLYQSKSSKEALKKLKESIKNNQISKPEQLSDALFPNKDECLPDDLLK